MSKAIELLVKLFDPRCVSFEAVAHGKGTLHKEQILASFAKAERDHFLGYQLLLLKYRQDRKAKDYLKKYIDLFLQKTDINKDYATRALNLVVDRLADIPLPTQTKRLNALRRRYLRSKFAYVKTLNIAENAAKQTGIDHNSYDGRAIRVKAINALRRSNICPRCQGTGEIGRVQKRACPSCEGQGRLVATDDQLFAAIGCDKAYYQTTLQPLISRFETTLLVEMSVAEDCIKRRLKAEIEE